MARDDLLQLGGVKYINLWAEHRPLRHAEQKTLRRRQASTVGDLQRPICQERADPPESRARENKHDLQSLQQDAVVDAVEGRWEAEQAEQCYIPYIGRRQYFRPNAKHRWEVECFCLSVRRLMTRQQTIRR